MKPRQGNEPQDTPLHLVGSAEPIARVREEDRVLACVRSNFAALSSRDLDAYMKTIDLSAHAPGQIDFIRSAMQALFNRFEVFYALETIELVGLDGDAAEVRVVQTARCADRAFQDNRSAIVHRLRKEGGVWRIVESASQWVTPI